MRGLAVLIAALLAGPVAAQSPDGDWLPTKVQVQALEATLIMPDGAGQLSYLHRTYRGITVDGRRLIVGMMVKPSPREAEGSNRTWPREAGVEILPGSTGGLVVMDGGCSVVNVRYDPESREVLAAFCNGDA